MKGNLKRKFFDYTFDSIREIRPLWEIQAVENYIKKKCFPAYICDWSCPEGTPNFKKSFKFSDLPMYTPTDLQIHIERAVTNSPFYSCKKCKAKDIPIKNFFFDGPLKTHNFPNTAECPLSHLLVLCVFLYGLQSNFFSAYDLLYCL